MGQAQGGMYLVETVDDVAAAERARSGVLAYVTQTTLSVDDAAAVVAALKERFPGIVGPKKDDICYATQNRQDAVKVMAPQVRPGDRGRLVPTAPTPTACAKSRRNRGVPAYMIDHADELRPEWVAGKCGWASPPGRPRRKCWCARLSRD